MASTMVSKVAMANDLGFGFGLAINKASHDYSTKLRPHRSHKYDKDAPKEYNSGKQRMHSKSWFIMSIYTAYSTYLLPALSTPT